jgi:bifunctional non-homologous end joining protein LigD
MSESSMPRRRGRSRRSLKAMLASVGNEIPSDRGWAFEPKYDGIRVLAFADGDAIALITRNQLDKATQFPEIVDAIRALGRRRKRPFVLDGEIVARKGKHVERFQALQSRLAETHPTKIATHVKSHPAVLVAFDVLVDGDDVAVHEPWTRRRKRLERLIGKGTGAGLMLGDAWIGNGKRHFAHARRVGWEGIMAKRAEAAYRPGIRSRDWLKLKAEGRQEFVVGGWTEPRKSRKYLGALLVGYWHGKDFVYAGHVGGGFTHEALREVHDRLTPLERKTSPFTETPVTNESAHWATPALVVEVKFNEWTSDGLLRQPVFVGMRDDKVAREVVREEAKGHRSWGVGHRP